MKTDCHDSMHLDIERIPTYKSHIFSCRTDCTSYLNLLEAGKNSSRDLKCM